jgi:GNAT superfamily N-acetyltransferase
VSLKSDPSFWQIRPVQTSDYSGLLPLLEQLGYPNTMEVVERYCTSRQDWPTHIILVAVAHNRLVGLMELAIMSYLHSGVHGEIISIVVDEQHRGKGLGKALLLYADDWFRARGIGDVCVRSRSSRTQAHQFYQKHGFVLSKTSHFFRMSLTDRLEARRPKE